MQLSTDILVCIVPDRAPMNVRATVDDFSSSILMEWLEIPCNNRNGNITGYTVMYTKNENQLRNVTDGLMVTIPNLEPGGYSVSIAGRNKQGLGPYSEKIQIVIRAPMQTTTLSFLNSASFYALVGFSACFVLVIIIATILVTIFIRRRRARIKHYETSVLPQ